MPMETIFREHPFNVLTVWGVHKGLHEALVILG